MWPMPHPAIVGHPFHPFHWLSRTIFPWKMSKHVLKSSSFSRSMAMDDVPMGKKKVLLNGLTLGAA
jgi:hypothetical protein